MAGSSKPRTTIRTRSQTHKSTRKSSGVNSSESDDPDYKKGGKRFDAGDWFEPTIQGQTIEYNGNSWVGKKALGAGGFGRVALWYQFDHEGNLVDVGPPINRFGDSLS